MEEYSVFPLTDRPISLCCDDAGYTITFETEDGLKLLKVSKDGNVIEEKDKEKDMRGFVSPSISSDGAYIAAVDVSGGNGEYGNLVLYNLSTGDKTNIDEKAAYPWLIRLSTDYYVVYEKWYGNSCSVIIRKIGYGYFEIAGVGRIDGNVVLHPKPTMSTYNNSYIVVGFTDYSGDNPRVRVVVFGTDICEGPIGDLTFEGVDPCVAGNVVVYRDASSNAIKAALIKITDSGCSVVQNVDIYRYNGSVSSLCLIPVYEDSNGGRYYLAVFTIDGKVHGVLFRVKYDKIQVLSTYDNSELVSGINTDIRLVAGSSNSSGPNNANLVLVLLGSDNKIYIETLKIGDPVDEIMGTISKLLNITTNINELNNEISTIKSEMIQVLERVLESKTGNMKESYGEVIAGIEEKIKEIGERVKVLESEIASVLPSVSNNISEVKRLREIVSRIEEEVNHLKSMLGSLKVALEGNRTNLKAVNSTSNIGNETNNSINSSTENATLTIKEGVTGGKNKKEAGAIITILSGLLAVRRLQKRHQRRH
ncbi:hypothetical protein [Methanopyrus sp.]